MQIWAQFDRTGEGELTYDQVLQLLHRQLPQLERSEMRQLLSYLHQIDTDGDSFLPHSLPISCNDWCLIMCIYTQIHKPELPLHVC